MFSLPIGFLEDTRNGLAVTSSLSLQNTTQTTIGNKLDGLEIVAFFKKVPFIVVKKNYRVLATDAGWTYFIENDVKASYEEFAKSETGTYIENANADGGKVIMDGEVYYAGTISVSEYESELLLFGPTTKYNMVETKNFSMPVGGHWAGNAPTVKGKLYFSATNFGYQATRTFVGTEASLGSLKVGDIDVIAGVSGRITSISKSGMKYAVGIDEPIFEWSIGLQASLGTEV